MDYAAWDEAIQSAVAELDDKQATSRAQSFLKKFPEAISVFRKKLAAAPLAIPLAGFQQHPTYLLRWLLAEWKDEDAKVLRTDLEAIVSHSLPRVQRTQEWRSGIGENWKLWGFKDMDDLYNNYKTSPFEEAKLQDWFPQRFYGVDDTSHPLHLELLPNTYDEKLLLPMSIRRIVNNEHTLRHRILQLNPAPKHLLDAAGSSADDAVSKRPDVLSNPILGATWVLDARNLSVWYSGAIYKTASALIEHSNKITSAHYPEQGYRTLVLNLGVVLGGLYNMAIKVMPPTVQSSTKCFVGNEGLADIMGGWGNVPSMYRNAKVKRLTSEEEAKVKGDEAPFVSRS